MTVDYLSLYMAEAPVSFALCRALECKVLARTKIEAPILDLGCGDGLFARIFFQGKPVEVGIDVSVDEARRARRAGSYKDVVLSTGAALPFASGSFKTVLSNSVLEHLTDLPATLGELHRILAPEGRMVITVPLSRASEYFFYSNVLSRIGASKVAERYARWKQGVWRHYNLFNEEGWVSAIKKVGFEIDDLIFFNSKGTVQFEDLLFPLSPPSLLIKKLLGRMVLRPATLSRIIARGVRDLYERDCPEGQKGATLCLVARKAVGALS